MTSSNVTDRWPGRCCSRFCSVHNIDISRVSTWVDQRVLPYKQYSLRTSHFFTGLFHSLARNWDSYKIIKFYNLLKLFSWYENLNIKITYETINHRNASSVPVVKNLGGRREQRNILFYNEISKESRICRPVSGGSMNPARTIGPAVASSVYKGLWVYIVGPVTGTLLGILSYDFIRTDKPLHPISSSWRLLFKLQYAKVVD